ncbi:TetR/AcrR family transcriptional regulator [Aquimarina algiphila]|uniref:TetR/AcrR family transcriptional regulator n=1 Tax=Aquimarina algiphila TaxID=2047982 RepID=A0A554VFH1_9FLAO|nr:TetR/AcrR family transcriptional regulator [Aquimarina algiphila]TSE05988.1 TetR/AcrR family transcriptional regulator [Aquimarina algiphila]
MSDKRIEILDLAENLIRTKGYNAFSYRDISGPLQIKNAAVHYHFPKKSDLGEEIIQRTRKKFQLKNKEWSHYSPQRRLDNFIALYEENQSLNLVCLVGALGSSYESLPENMQNNLSEMSREIRIWMMELLKEGLAKKEFNFAEKPNEKADLIIASLLSSLILDKVIRENIFKSVKASILKGV